MNMNQSLVKTLLYSGLVLCGGFAILSWIEQDAAWVFWLIGFCIVLSIFFALFHPGKKPVREPELESVLPDSARRALSEGRIPQLTSPLKLKSGEALLWADQMRTDYYNSKPRLFYLTTQRLVCLDEDFRFSHPISEMELTFGEDSVRIRSGKSVMPFKAASLSSLEQAWKLAAGRGSSGQKKHR